MHYFGGFFTYLGVYEPLKFCRLLDPDSPYTCIDSDPLKDKGAGMQRDTIQVLLCTNILHQ